MSWLKKKLQLLLIGAPTMIATGNWRPWVARQLTIAATALPRRLWPAGSPAPDAPRRVLFNVNLANHYPLYAPLIELLREDGDFELAFADPGKMYTSPAELLGRYGVPARECITAWQAAFQRWDLVVECSFASLLPVLARTWKSAQIFHGVAHKFLVSGQDITFHPRLANYDLVAALSQGHQEILRGSGILKHADAAKLVGYPKLDPLARGDVDRDAVLRDYGADPQRTTVLYAPTWNVEQSLHQVGAEVIDTLIGHDVQLLVKPHPMSLPSSDSLRTIPLAIEQKRWDQFLQRRHDEGKLVWVKDDDTSRYLGAADVLITDYGSTPFEYMVTGRPIVYFDTDDARRTMSDPETMQRIEAATVPFHDARSCMSALQQILAEPRVPADRADAMKAIVSQRFFDPGAAAKRLFEHLSSAVDKVP